VSGFYEINLTSLDPALITSEVSSSNLSKKMKSKDVALQDEEKLKREKEYEKIAFGDKYEDIKVLLKNGTDSELCGKLNVLKALLITWVKLKKSKVLLFSYSTKNMDILERFLRKERYSFNRLDGSTPITQRQKIVDNFNNSPNKFIFLISTKVVT
jgi:SNF2 family DNA or RNA helicase